MLFDGKKVVMTYDEYDTIVETCEKVKENANDVTNFDAKKKFMQMDRFPKVDEIVAHHVEEHLDQYLPYLIFYLEVYESDDPEFKRTKAYLRDLLCDLVELHDKVPRKKA